jgi:hypothetical protein
MLDIRVRSRVEDERITVGSEDRAGNGGNLADEVWVDIVREEPSSHDVKLVADSQDRVSHTFLLDLSAVQRIGDQLRGTGRRPPLKHLRLMPECYQTLIGKRCATSAAAPC